jgi:hypothetical protein
MQEYAQREIARRVLRRKAIRQIPCERCGAQPGERCVRPGGMPLADAHRERRVAYDTANPPT